MTDDPLDAMKAGWSYIQFCSLGCAEDNDPITALRGRLVTTLDVIGLEAFRSRAAQGAGPASGPRNVAPSPERSWPRRSWAFPPPAP